MTTRRRVCRIASLVSAGGGPDGLGGLAPRGERPDRDAPRLIETSTLTSGFAPDCVSRTCAGTNWLFPKVPGKSSAAERRQRRLIRSSNRTYDDYQDPAGDGVPNRHRALKGRREAQPQLTCLPEVADVATVLLFQLVKLALAAAVLDFADPAGDLNLRGSSQLSSCVYR